VADAARVFICPMQHQGIFIGNYLQMRGYDLDVVSELTGIPEDRLQEVLKM
jgi:hypothetical protein